jgi:hypothetical protein
LPELDLDLFFVGFPGGDVGPGGPWDLLITP